MFHSMFHGVLPDVEPVLEVFNGPITPGQIRRRRPATTAATADSSRGQRVVLDRVVLYLAVEGTGSGHDDC